MSTISFMLDLSAGDKIAFFGFILAVASFLFTWCRYRSDQRQQRAAQTRQDLQAIIGDCNRFLRPLSQSSPYPLLHVSRAIAKEFCTFMGPSSVEEDVLELFDKQELLLSICVEGWINSSQIQHMMDLVEEVEHKAASWNLQGKLLLVCHASYLLAGWVAEVCSPEAFFEVLCRLDPKQLDTKGKDKVEDILNALTVKLQEEVCTSFNNEHKEAIQRCIYFIQTAAGIFINEEDYKLMRLMRQRERQVPFYPGTDPIINKIEDANSLSNRLKQVRKGLECVQTDLDPKDREDMYALVEQMQKDCDAQEKESKSARKKINLSNNPQHLLAK